MKKIVCFTGHRRLPPAQIGAIMEELEREIEHRIREGAEIFRAGGALGFDTLAALAVLRLRKQYPQIRLELILPCPDQTRGWRQTDVMQYQQILQYADSYRYVSEFYYNGLLLVRNRHLVDGADVCIAYLTHTVGGGSAYTSSYAIRSGLEYVNLAERIAN